MDPEREQELLMHLAAGTDLLTAMAALPRERDLLNESEPAPTSASAKCRWLPWAFFIGTVAVWWLLTG